MIRIAIIEDEKPVNEALMKALTKAWPNYAVDQYFDRLSAEKALDSIRYDLIILDLELNTVKNAGIGIINKINKSHRTPVIVVSGMPADIYRSIMRELDAWDFLQKPFDPQALLTVVDLALRGKRDVSDAERLQQERATDNELVFTAFARDPVTWKGKRLNLTLTQLRLVKLLFDSKGHVVPRESLTKLLTSGNNATNLRAHVSAIREEFKSVDPAWNQIRTIPGHGYEWIK